MNTRVFSVTEARKALLVWLVLIGTTILSALIGGQSELGLLAVMGIVLLLIVKAQLIIDHFMALKGVAVHWRWLMSAYSVVIGLLVILAYSLSL